MTEDIGDLMWKGKVKMTEKIPQMTEEQAIDFLRNVNGGTYSSLQLVNMKRLGYIKKSELQQLVEEAEDLYSSNVMPFVLNFEKMGVVKNVLQERLDCIHKLYNAIQAFKTKYPEFKKC